MKFFLILVIPLFILTACDTRSDLMPNITGKAGEVVIVLDKSFKEGEPGKLFRKYFLEAYPQLPQEESISDPVLLPTNAFNHMFQTHRSILICTISTTDSASIKVSRNVWAQPQLVMEITAGSGAELTSMIEEHHQKIVNYFTNGERKRLIENYRKYIDKIISGRIEKKFNIELAIPKGYKLDVDTGNFVWISNETQHTSQGVFVYTLPGKFIMPEDAQSFINKRDSILKIHVPGSLPNSWMLTEKEIPITVDTVWNNNVLFDEIRGLWRVENDYMGGPFLTTLTYLPEKNTTLIIDGFVYAPRFNKRTYMQQIEAILYSVKFK